MGQRERDLAQGRNAQRCDLRLLPVLSAERCKLSVNDLGSAAQPFHGTGSRIEQPIRSHKHPSFCLEAAASHGDAAAEIRTARGTARYLQRCICGDVCGTIPSICFRRELGVRSIRRILLSVKDPGVKTLPAVAKGIQLARAFGAELELFHALASPVYLDMLGLAFRNVEDVENEQREEYRQRLERIAARARLHTGSVSVAVEWDYPAYEAIVRRATHVNADLIVAEQYDGRHHAPGILRLADWELLRLCPVPVLLVKQTRLYHRPTVLTAIDPEHVGGKTAQLDDEILRTGTLVTQALCGSLHVVHACLPGPQQTAAHAEQGLRSRDEAAFEQALRLWDIPPEGRHLLAGDPSEVVHAVAQRIGANIVVAGALSRSGLQRVLIGNTAERLLDHLPCDLLIVKPAEFACRVPSESRGVHLICAQPSA